MCVHKLTKHHGSFLGVPLPTPTSCTPPAAPVGGENPKRTSVAGYGGGGEAGPCHRRRHRILVRGQGRHVKIDLPRALRHALNSGSILPSTTTLERHPHRRCRHPVSPFSNPVPSAPIQTCPLPSMPDASTSEGVEESIDESDASGSERDASGDGDQEACPRIDASGCEGDASGSEDGSEDDASGEGDVSGSEDDASDDASDACGSEDDASDDASDASGSEDDASDGSEDNASVASDASGSEDDASTRDEESEGGSTSKRGDAQGHVSMADACALLRERWQPWHVGNGFRRKRKALTLLLPCAGFESPGRSMTELNMPYEVKGAWEVAAGPCKVLRSMYAKRPDRVNFHCGPRDGDICSVNPKSLPDAEGLISGPPCPPFSSIGKIGGWQDPRGKILLRILKWLRVLVRRGCLRFFILENVVCILRAKLRFLLQLREVLRPEWHVEVLRMNAESTGQSRKRVYIVGVKCPGGMSPGKTQVKRHLLKLPDRPLSSVILNLPNTKKAA